MKEKVVKKVSGNWKKNAVYKEWFRSFYQSSKHIFKVHSVFF